MLLGGAGIVAAVDLDGQDVIVLGLQRAKGRYESAPSGTVIVRAGDRLVVYGPASVIESQSE